jgi:hypothetical protein
MSKDKISLDKFIVSGFFAFPYTVSVGNYCSEGFHAYPQSYAGSPEYAAAYFSRCLCGRRKKVATVTEIDVVDLKA